MSTDNSSEVCENFQHRYKQFFHLYSVFLPITREYRNENVALRNVHTERCSWVVSNPDSYSDGPEFYFRSGARMFCLRVFMIYYSPSRQVLVYTLKQNLLLPFTSIPIHSH